MTTIKKRLTAKEEAFAIAIVKGMVISAAYREAGYRSQGDRDSTEGSRLLDRPAIAARIAELREPVVKHARLEMHEHLAKLAELRDKAAGVGDFGPAITAEVNRGKASGLYVTKNVHGFAGGAGEEAEDLEFRITVVQSKAPAASARH